MRWLALAVVAFAVFVGCSLHAHGSRGRLPEAPGLGTQIERAGRALTGNSLLGLFASSDASNRSKESYNGAAPADWAQFAPELERGLRFYDGFDGIQGNQWLADARALATVLADDRLWVNTAATRCTRYLAVELDALASPPAVSSDCGGRTPNYDAVDVFRSLLVNGTVTGVPDGVDRDDRVHSTTTFPFLGSP